MKVGRGEFGPVRLAWADTSAPEAVRWTEADLHALGDQQLRRYRSLGYADARRFLVGRGLLVELIGELHGGHDLGFTTTCERCGADHGRPRLERTPVGVSVSYAGSLVAVAAARHRDAAGVGVDVEREPGDGAQTPLHLGALFSPAPSPDVAGWTLIEAALKADGRGVAVDFGEVQIGAIGSGRLPASRAVRLPGRADGVDAAIVPGPAGFVLSAAMVPAVWERHPA
jgi:4'-phosphopantetheinyl transferase